MLYDYFKFELLERKKHTTWNSTITTNFTPTITTTAVSSDSIVVKEECIRKNQKFHNDNGIQNENKYIISNDVVVNNKNNCSNNKSSKQQSTKSNYHHHHQHRRHHFYHLEQKNNNSYCHYHNKNQFRHQHYYCRRYCCHYHHQYHRYNHHHRRHRHHHQYNHCQEQQQQQQQSNNNSKNIKMIKLDNINDDDIKSKQNYYCILNNDENLLTNNNNNDNMNKICIICRNYSCTFHINCNNIDNDNINNKNNNTNNYKYKFYNNNNNNNDSFKRHDSVIKNRIFYNKHNSNNIINKNKNHNNKINPIIEMSETETNYRKYPRRRKISYLNHNNNNNDNNTAIITIATTSMPNILKRNNATLTNNNNNNLEKNFNEINNNNNKNFINESSSNCNHNDNEKFNINYEYNKTSYRNNSCSYMNENINCNLKKSNELPNRIVKISHHQQHQQQQNHDQQQKQRCHKNQDQQHQQYQEVQKKCQHQQQRVHNFRRKHSKWYYLSPSSSLLLLQVFSHRILFLIENFSNSIRSTQTTKTEIVTKNNKTEFINMKSDDNTSKSIEYQLKMTKLWRTFTRKLLIFIMWSAILVFLVNFSLSLLIAGAYANEINGPRLRNFSKVCTSMDIRNTPKSFENLSNCSVIEGFLVISLIDKYSEHDYENLTFPLLTEITDYLLVYRVNGLRTLGNLFPNLSVIRGNTLFEGYALVIYENNNLQEIDLKSLTTIKRGAVRVEKNPLLCFVETINWSKIAVNTSHDSHFFRGNKVINECASCPSGEDDGPKCPLYPGGVRYCWNRKHCQKICPDRCKNTCNDKGECCHESCVGGCDNNDVRLCSVCRNLVFGSKCVKTCPDKFFQFLERSCISAEECFSKKPSLNPDIRHEYPYVIHDGICTTRCPNNYEKVNNQTCEPCKNGKCLRKCPGAQIDSISDARRLRGCTVITSSLLISIRQTGQHLMEDLENALSSIEEIEGHLKVSRSFALLSLSFLKQLRVIKGYELESEKYALYVLDNQNLQNIWGDNQTVIIERGRIFFHFNPKLCYYKIKNLLSMMKDNAPLETSEVATDSNGDRGSCNITTLNVTVTRVASRAAVVIVEPMEFDDDRGFIGYQYYYIEAPHKNVSIYDSRHGCGNDGWNVDDDNTKSTHHIFTHLKPFTQYAFYVKTYTITSEHKNGQSNIIYFRTEPDKPDMVRNLKHQILSSSEVMIRWFPPREANGNLTTYVIKANLTALDPKLLDQRNYCSDPIKPSASYEISQVLQPTTSEKDMRQGVSDKDCMCVDGDNQGKKSTNEPDEHVIENAIDFEDKIQNFIYIKHEKSDSAPKSVRRKREDKFSITLSSSQSSSSSMTSTDTSTDPGDKVFPQTDLLTVTNEIDPKEITKSRKEGNYYTYIYETVNTSVHEFIFKDLKHYSWYTISVKACREGSQKDKIQDRCSVEAITVARTKRKVGADDVKHWKVDVESTNNSRSFIRLNWEPPPNPNSMIVSYSIKYKRADIEHAKSLDKCITAREYQNLTNGYILSGLDSGNYSLQLMATSLAGDGNFTEPRYVIIPESKLAWQIVTAIVLAPIILIILICILIWYVRKKYLLQQPNNMKLITTVNPEYVSMQYTPDEWELPRDKIVQLRELGQGSFGMVYEGIVKSYGKNNDDIPCAIKTVNESATDRERANFLKEASVMKDFDTHHVVRLLGVVSRGQPTLVVMELMINGDLKGYLRQHRPDAENLDDGEPPPQPPTLRRILQMAIEIADGMAYLSAKKYVHRDLAARNCMVAADLTVKIGDFGMTRDIYETDYYRKGTKGLLPVRWMAPESLKDGVFTSSSDVFSYGVVLWEMATLASQPYQGLSNDQVLRYVIDGGVMERPENCPDKLYNLMQKCWQHRPSSRPTFMDIIQYLLDDADPRFRRVSFYHSEPGKELLAQMSAATDIDDVTTPLRVGDDDFKMDVDDNFLLNRADSHLVQDEQPHSPYSLGFEVKICSTPGDASHQRYSRNSPSIRMSDLGNTAAASATAAPAQRSSSSILPPRLRGIEFIRNAFWGVGGGNGNSNATTINNGKDDNRPTITAGNNNSSVNNGVGGLGHKNFLRAFVRFGTVGSSSNNNRENGVEMKRDENPRGGIPKNYQKLNESNASTKSVTTPVSVMTNQSGTNSTLVEEYPEITSSSFLTATGQSGTDTTSTTREIPETRILINTTGRGDGEEEEEKEKVRKNEKKNNSTYPLFHRSQNNIEELSLPSLQQNNRTQEKQCNDRNLKVIKSRSNSDNSKEMSEIASPCQSQRREEEEEDENQQEKEVTESLPLASLAEQHQQQQQKQRQQWFQELKQEQQQQQANGYIMQGRESEIVLNPFNRQSPHYQSINEKLLPHSNNQYQIIQQQNRGNEGLTRGSNLNQN